MDKFKYFRNYFRYICIKISDIYHFDIIWKYACLNEYNFLE